MNLFALDELGKLISAEQAKRHQNYFCLECKGTLRAKQGLKKRFHFFHADAASSCRQNGKSLEHLRTQQKIFELLPDNECQLERPFKDIDRIADVVWEKEKLIFEVQCSSISPFEALRRIKDYASLGYSVIWILHENKFGLFKGDKWQLSKFPHYFTNMNFEKSGYFYDRRLFLKTAIFLNQPIRTTSPFWPIRFLGDFHSGYKENLTQRAKSILKQLFFESLFLWRTFLKSKNWH